MTRQTRIRLFSLLVLLGVLAGVLATPDTENAYAAPCCSSCDYRELACIQGTLYPECGGNPDCCFNKVASCWRWCNSGC